MIFKRLRINILISVYILSLIHIGGCDIDFSTNEDDGQGVADMESVSGRVINVIPDIGIEGIVVEITNDEDVDSQDTTDASGNFTVQGDFNESPAVVKFLDPMDVNLGSLNVNIFPGVDMDLGDIEIDNGVITLDNDVMVVFFGDIIAIDCVGNDGSIDVEIDNIDVTIQIDGSTDIERESDNEDITCDELLIGQEVRVDGDLTVPTGTIIDASDIQVQN